MVNRKTVENFLLRVESEYKPNSYHNNIHATDVTQTAAIIMQSFAKQVHDIPKMDVFCIIMASAVHDLGHLGVNNDFLINSKHPRATTYNDKSVNENYHISRAFELARTTAGCDIFEKFTFDEQKRVRGRCDGRECKWAPWYACLHGRECMRIRSRSCLPNVQRTHQGCVPCCCDPPRSAASS